MPRETCRYCGAILHWSDVDDTGTPVLVGPDGQTLCLSAPGIAGAHTAS